jgi:hypothetical protein
MPTGDDLRGRLRAIEIEKREAREELARVERRQRELKAAIKACDRSRDELLADLVVDRPLIDLAEEREAAREEPTAPDPLDGQIVGPSGEVEDIGLATPGPAYTWHSYPIERCLPEARWRGLREDLIDGELGTLGAIASWLSDGNTLEELELGPDNEAARRITVGEVKALRAALLRTVYHLKIEAEFPPAWIDPEIGRTVQPIEATPKPKRARKAKAKADPEPEPEAAGQLAVFAVRPKAQKTPVHFVRARSLKEADDFTVATRSKGSSNHAYPWDGPPPKGAWVQTAGARP